MSENLWGGLLLRTQSRGCCEVVLNELKGLLDEAERACFVALKGTRLTWVYFEPLDLDDLITLAEDGPSRARKIAKALKREVWLVANSDYSGREFCSFDATGKRRWSGIEDQPDEEPPKRSPRLRLEEEAGLDWDKFIDFEGIARRSAWKKTARLQQARMEKPRPEKSKQKRQLAPVVRIERPPPHPHEGWRKSVMLKRLAHAHDRSRDTRVFQLPNAAVEKLEAAARAADKTPDELIEARWKGPRPTVTRGGEKADDSLCINLPLTLLSELREFAAANQATTEDVLIGLIGSV